MPGEGTKQIELDGRKMFLPADEVEIDQLVKDGIALDADLDELKAKMSAIKERVVALAEKRRDGAALKSVRLVAPSGVGAVLVKFPTETQTDDQAAAELEKELPNTIFETLFAKKTVYSPVRGLSQFLKRPQAPELERLKLRVAKIISFKAKRPTVEFEGDTHAPLAAESEDS